MSDTESDPRNPKRVKLISSTAEEDIDLSELDLDQLQDVVGIRTRQYKTKNLITVKFFRCLILKYAPGLVGLFEDPRVTAVQLRDVSPTMLKYFSAWLCSCYVQDYSSAEDAKDALDWALLEPETVSDRDFTRWGMSRLFMEPLDPRLCQPDHTAMALYSVELLSFAKYYRISRLRYDAIDRIRWYFCFLISGRTFSRNRSMKATVCRVYKDTKPGSPLRQLMVDGYDMLPTKPSLRDQYPYDYVVDILENREKDGRITEWKENECYYHEHQSEGEEKRCQMRVDFHNIYRKPI